MNERGIEPGTIDDNYVRPADVRQDVFDPDGRNISPGTGDTGVDGVKTKQRSGASSNMSNMPPASVFDMEVITIVRATKQKRCPVRGCTQLQGGNQPFEFKTRDGLHKHVRAKHPGVDTNYVMKTMDILLGDK